jgi:hypothetical protein
MLHYTNKPILKPKIFSVLRNSHVMSLRYFSEALHLANSLHPKMS